MSRVSGGNEGMEKKIETTITGYIGTTIKVRSLLCYAFFSKVWAPFSFTSPNIKGNQDGTLILGITAIILPRLVYAVVSAEPRNGLGLSQKNTQAQSTNPDAKDPCIAPISAPH